MPLTPETVMALGIVFVPFITGFMAKLWGSLNGRSIIFPLNLTSVGIYVAWCTAFGTTTAWCTATQLMCAFKCS